MKDSRTDERLAPDEPFEVRDAHDDCLLGNLANLSFGGLMLVSQAPLTTDSVYDVFVAPADKARAGSGFRVGVESVWSQATGDILFWTGLRIISMSEQDAKQVAALVQRFSDQDQ